MIKVKYYLASEVNEMLKKADEGVFLAMNELAVMNVGSARDLLDAVRVKLSSHLTENEMEFDTGDFTLNPTIRDS